MDGRSTPPSAAAAVLTAMVAKPPPMSEARQFISTLDTHLGTIEPGRAADYVIYLMATMPAELAALLEELMQTRARTYHSEYSDRLRAEGRKEGLELGEVRHARNMLVRLLEGTQSGLTPEQRGRIDACDSLQQLDAWILKVSGSGSAAEVLGE